MSEDADRSPGDEYIGESKPRNARNTPLPDLQYDNCPHRRFRTPLCTAPTASPTEILPTEILLEER
jgi:hypothetical protein